MPDTIPSPGQSLESFFSCHVIYFGEPVYIYSLRDGINDGFLTPFKIINCRIAMKTPRGAPLAIPAPGPTTAFGKLLKRVEGAHRSLVIEKDGNPQAVLLSIQNYAKLAAPEPEVMKAIGRESKQKGTDRLTSSAIDRVIKAARAKNPNRR